MASDQDKLNLRRLRANGSSMPQVVPNLPDLPQDVVKRFPSMRQWHETVNRKYRQDFAVALGWHLPPE